MPEWRNAAAGGSSVSGSAKDVADVAGTSPTSPTAAFQSGIGASEGLPPAHSSGRRNSCDPFSAQSYYAQRGGLLAPVWAHEEHCPRGIFYLSPATTFVGLQTADRSWKVTVTIIDCDLPTGTVRGMLHATPPSDDSPIRTYWEGEIIDNVNHSLLTNKWDATAAADSKHWSKFEAFRSADTLRRGKRIDFSQETHVFMRWKERFFLDQDAEDCGMSIAGFYYICLNRLTGALEGYYYDKSSTPNQHLALAPRTQTGSGAQAHSRFVFA